MLYSTACDVQGPIVRGVGVAAALMMLFAADTVAPARDLVVGGSGSVREVVDGDTLVLEDGTVVRLVGIQVPKLALGRPGFVAQPLAQEARAALEGLVAGRRVRLSYGGAPIDRHGRALAHLHDESGVWIQGALLRRGLARVYSFRDNRALVTDMLALEAGARSRRLGIWALPYYQVRTIDEAPRYVGSFQIVEGRVRSAAMVRGRVYLNFGDDWRTDFTITVAPRDRRLFALSQADLAGFAERRVRVRGWLKSFNGPMIEATHPEQIEVIDE